MKDQLFKLDKTLAKACKDIELPELTKSKDYFNYLVKAVVFQQLSGKAAQTIYNRFLGLFGDKPPIPEELVKMPVEKLRSVGLSGQKASYVVNISEFAIGKGMEVKKIDKMSDEEVLKYLTSIKGVGKWTVEMMLIFAMLRPDVFPLDDLGIQQGMAKMYKLDSSNLKGLQKEMLRISEKWVPFRSLGTRLTWAWKDKK